MGKRLLSFLVVCLCAVSMAFAQKQVTGKVVDAETGEPVVGASVIVKGTSIGAATNLDGKFTIQSVPNSATTLVVSYIGMKTKEVAVKSSLSVALESDAKSINDVLVVGYGTQTKASFTGAATTVSGEKIEKMQVSNLSKALEGAVAGVQIASSSGTPGSGASIHIRGIGSISGSSSPLIVVDGVPYEGSLNSIPTHDIESMTILKDAAANSIYGARGSNGVILISTKNGKAGKVNINFDARMGWNSRGVSNYDIITDPGEYYEMTYEAIRNQLTPSMGMAAAADYAAKNLVSGYTKYNKFAGIADDQIIDPTTGRLNPNAKTYKWSDDWTKDPFQANTRQEYNLNISGGTESTKAYASVGYLKDNGMVSGSGFDRMNARVKVDQKLRNNIRVSANLGYSRTDMKTFGDEGSNYSNIFMFSQAIAPIYPIYFYDANGNRATNNAGGIYDFGTEYTRPYASEQNPVATSEANINNTERDNFTSRGMFEWKFLKDFTFTANIAYDVFNSYGTEFMTPIGGDAYNVGGRGYKDTQRYAALNANELLDWNHNFGKHGVHILLGHENKQNKSRYMYGHMTNFADVNNPEFANAAVYQDLTSYTSEYTLEGYFAKGEYNYDDKYYFTSSIRRDGSSHFGPDNRWGTFWSVGASWRLKEEAWLKDVSWLDNLKVKVSYGTQGNDMGLPANQMYNDLYAVDRVDGAIAFSKVFRGNPDLTWEKSRNFNAGFEASFWNRLNVGFDFFIKETRDLLYASPLASSEGQPSTIWRNEMNMKNTGIEFEIDGDIIQTRNLTWNMGLNLTHYKNELTRLPDSKPADKYPNGYQAGAYWRRLGGSLYDFYRYEYVGVDAETGLPQYNHYTYKKDENGETVRDANGDEVVESVEIVNKTSEATLRQTGKSAIPAITGGLSTSLNAYGFDLSIATAFQLGGYVLDSHYAQLMNCGEKGTNLHKDMFNRWTPANTDTNIPALCYESQTAGIDGSSDFFLTSASYFSIRNVTLGYTIPRRILEKAGISTIRIYGAADNLFLLSARKGLDPRQSFSGSTGYVYSALRTMSIGLQIGF